MSRDFDFFAVAGEERRLIEIAAEADIAFIDLIQDNPIEIFFFEFLLCQLEATVSFGGKADQGLLWFFDFAQSGQDVRIFDEGQLEPFVGLFNLFAGRSFHAVVGHGGHLKDVFAVVEVAEGGGKHLARRRDLDKSAGFWWFEPRWPGDENNAVAQPDGGPSQGISHLARRVVADVTDGVDGLDGGAGGDEEAFFFHRA